MPTVNTQDLCVTATTPGNKTNTHCQKLSYTIEQISFTTQFYNTNVQNGTKLACLEPNLAPTHTKQPKHTVAHTLKAHISQPYSSMTSTMTRQLTTMDTPQTPKYIISTSKAHPNLSLLA